MSAAKHKRVARARKRRALREARFEAALARAEKAVTAFERATARLTYDLTVAAAERRFRREAR